MYILAFDGLFRSLSGTGRGNQHAGVLCYGWLVTREQVTLARGYGAFVRGQEADSNVAEYLALIEGLEALGDLGVRDDEIMIFGDSKSVIDQMRGTASVNAAAIRPLFHRAQRLSQRFAEVAWVWTPRCNNRDADLLTRRAMRQVRLNSPAFETAIQEALYPASRRKLARRLIPLVDLLVYQPVSFEEPLNSAHFQPETAAL